MTTMDQTFIRAYGDESSATATSEQARRTAAPPQAGRGRLLPLRSDKSTVVPPPHASFDRPSTEKAHTSQGHTLQGEPAHLAAAVAQYDLGYDAVIDPTGYDAPSSEAQTSCQLETAPHRHAAFEVDHVRWPAACDQIAKACGTALDELCDQLIAEAAQGRKVLGVTGAAAGVGTTTLALTLARTLLRHNLRIAVVDANVDQPLLARQLGLAVEYGWNNGTTAGESLIDCLAEPLSVLPLATPRGTGAADVAGLPALLAELAGDCDLVLVDCPAVPPIGDLPPQWPSVQRGIEAVLLACRPGLESAAEQRRAVRTLQSAGVAVLGIIENDVPHN